MPENTRLHTARPFREPASPDIRPEATLSGAEPANDASHVQEPGPSEGQDLAISRAELAQAIHHWGEAGQGGEPGMKLAREASVLVEVLALMDFEHQTSVLLPRSSRPGQLVLQAIEARQAQACAPGLSTQRNPDAVQRSGQRG